MLLVFVEERDARLLDLVPDAVAAGAVAAGAGYPVADVLEGVVVAVAWVGERADPGRAGAVEHDRDLVTRLLELLRRHKRVRHPAHAFANFAACEDDECCFRHPDSSFEIDAGLEAPGGGSGSRRRRI
ncbi:MAG TPA: hypothetical protein VE596_14060 [Gaiellaceae bacterium]|jgi:hypothetical protein|nr:hypothetical protein [Gaiellaceae bacterium]